MRIERIAETALKPQDDAAIAALLAVCFETDFGGRSFYQQRHHVRLLSRNGADMIGHLALCYREVRLGQDLVPIAGLAEVATHPDWQGQGIAGRLLDVAIDEVATWQARFFVLFGDRPLYAARGFRPMGNQITFLTLDGARTGQIKTGRDGGLMVREMGRGAWDPQQALDLLGHKF